MPRRPIAIATDFEPRPLDERLRAIAAAGFDGVHWCDHWDDDYRYDAEEMARWRVMLDELGLTCADLHGSAGRRGRWTHIDDEKRRRGIELVENRVRLAAALGAGVVVMHVEPDGDAFGGAAQLDRLADSLEKLRLVLAETGVRIALENLFGGSENADVLAEIFDDERFDALGFCYDPGHAAITGDGVAILERHIERLLAIHLNDNNGRRDQHRVPGQGGVDWPAVLRVLVGSDYAGPVTLELVNRRRWWGGRDGMDDFLQRAYKVGAALVF